MIYKRIHKTYTDIHAIQMSAMFPFVPLGILKLAISFLGTKVKNAFLHHRDFSPSLLCKDTFFIIHGALLWDFFIRLIFNTQS